MRLSLSLLIGYSIYSSQLFASSLINQELISCENRTGLLRNCAVNSGTLLNKQSYESDFYVSYSLSCDRGYPGPRPSSIEVSVTDGGSVPLNYKDSKNDLYIGSGYGPLTLSDSLPAQLKSRSFSSGCSLKFSSISAKVSPEVVNSWKVERDGKVALLDEKNKLLTSYDYLSVLKPGFEIVKSVANLVIADLDVAHELAVYLRKFQTCNTNEAGEEVDCQLFLRLIGENTDRLTFAEKMFISKLNSTLLQIDPEAPESIEDYLSEGDLKLLASIAEKSKEFEDLDNKIKVLSDEIATLDAQIKKLNFQIGGQ